MPNNINYQKKFFEIINKIDVNNKPRLLLHACCGPCFTIPYELLKDYFDITIMYNNSNIYPMEEYIRRKDELKEYINKIDAKINIIETPYDNEIYNQDLIPFFDQKEGHERCRVCFRKRLSEGFKFASENGFDFYGTVMTISRYKNAQDINKIGAELEQNYSGVKWLYADFKKNDGYEKSLKIIKNFDMYFQEYCGCIFSYNSYLKKLKKNEK